MSLIAAKTQGHWVPTIRLTYNKPVFVKWECKKTQGGDGTASTYDHIRWKRWVVLMYDIVASKIILLVTSFNSELLNKGILHKKAVVFMSLMYGAVISESWPKGTACIESNLGQWRKKCLLFSMPVPQLHIGVKQSKLCRKIRSFDALSSILCSLCKSNRCGVHSRGNLPAVIVL